MGRFERSPALASFSGKRFAIVGLIVCGLTALGGSCSGFNPVAIQSPDVGSNIPPSLTVLAPLQNLAIGQGDPFIIRWTSGPSGPGVTR